MRDCVGTAFKILSIFAFFLHFSFILIFGSNLRFIFADLIHIYSFGVTCFVCLSSSTCFLQYSLFSFAFSVMILVMTGGKLVFLFSFK